MNPGEDPRRAALLSALEEAEAALKRLRFDDKRRGDLARRVVKIEDALDALEV